jgi:hypothetical protein
MPEKTLEKRGRIHSEHRHKEEMTKHHFSLGDTDDYSNFRFSTDKNFDGSAGLSEHGISV